MQSRPYRFLPLLAALAAGFFPSPAMNAADPLVFVSSFAGGEKGAISAFRLSLDDGSLTPLERTGGIENPFFLAISPDQHFLYAIHAKAFGGDEDEEIAAYKIDKATGRLTLLNRQSAKGSASCYLEVDATGKTVLVANYASGSVAALPVKADGSLGEAASFVQHKGGSNVDPKRQNGPFAHSIIVSPDNRFAYSADLGLDQILAYRLDPANAKLEPASPAFVASPPGAGPRHLTFAPDGKNLYAIDELSNTVTRYSRDADSGTLTKHESTSTLPDDFKGDSYCADLKFTPTGLFLYGTNRGHDSLAIFRAGEDGALTRVGIVPSLGKGPQNLLVTPDGKWLLCANMPGNNLAVFRIDGESGKLTSAGAPLEITMPSCIRLLP
ncbi:MAG TPA: lactonase family protein [Verrucomicrobiales bacterium]|mgnify:CR=1 FL=1|nr:lactonase family protein [Verrucomicrobiales bacterium]